MASIKAILFDMDGVLIDAKDWHYEALNRALELFGLTISRYEHLSVYDGLPTSKKLDLLSREKQLPRSLHNFINQLKQKYTTELIFQRCHPRFQHQYALSRLKKEGYHLALCSNSIRRTVELMMQKSDLLCYFDALFSNEDVIMPKPAPDIYQIAFHKLNLKPSECLILEDNPHGIEAAKSAGGFVMEVGSVEEVTYESITNSINYYNRSVL